MTIQDLIESGNYIDEFKKHKVIYRKYPKKGLLIAKRKYGCSYSPSEDWLNYCRGLVIDYINHKIVFLPPVKSSEILTRDEFLDTVENSYELVDGTMVNMFYYNDEWNLSTRSNIGCTNQWSKDINFKQMFDECKQFNTDDLDRECSYSFVMRHKKNRIISKISENKLYLVEIRKNNKLNRDCRLPEGCLLPEKSSQISGLKKGLTGYNGVIRYKWITNEHKFLDMIKPNTNNSCLNYLILRNSGYLTQYLKMFPEYRFEFNTYRNRLHDITKQLYEYYKHVFISKDLEKSDIPFVFRPLLYDIHGIYLQKKQGITWTDIKQYIHELEPKRLQFVINKL